MQYLSQRLATESTRTREGQRLDGPLGAGQRDRILDAAERLIAERGCSGASIEAIVKVAGVSSVTFYEHFRDKEACFVAAFQRAIEEGWADIGGAVAGDAPWLDQARACLRALLDVVAAEPARARMCLVEAQMGGPQLRASYEAVLDRAMAKLREGRSLEAAPVDLSDTHEEAIVGGLAWLLRERLELSGGGGVEGLYPRMVEIVLSPYLGDGAPPLAAAVEPASGDG